MRLLVLIGLAISTGCLTPPPPYVPAYRLTPPVTHCFDGVPHLPQSKPWILGGACCCTPSDQLLDKLHAAGICRDLDTNGLISLYSDKGVRLALDHGRCNNLCEYGPHVTKGGKCMVPPMPGTRNYQEVITGVVLRPPLSDKSR